jgi:hypothetical protein
MIVRGDDDPNSERADDAMTRSVSGDGLRN